MKVQARRVCVPRAAAERMSGSSWNFDGDPRG
jgi:hypothetical protein